MPLGQSDVSFEPVAVKSKLPDGSVCGGVAYIGGHIEKPGVVRHEFPNGACNYRGAGRTAVLVGKKL